jgi:GTP-binding protein EngB required for normal cell division
MDEIETDYKENGQYQVTRTEHKNVMLIGRTRVGKSTMKSLLVDPTVVPDDSTLKSGTREPLFESFHVHDNHIVLNIIDTPGLFEHGNDEIDVRDNETILHTIEICANREITKFHVVCFCVAITAGINREDIDSLKLLVEFLGKDISKNSCLIVTRCESKDEKQREKMRAELFEDNYFKEIAPFFKLGILFSGSLDPDDYNKGNDSLLDQFITISDYRMKLVELFTSEIEPFPMSDMLMSHIRRIRDEESLKDIELQVIRAQNQEQTRIIEELRVARLDDQRDTADIIERLLATKIYEHQEKARVRTGPGHCVPS